jgi:hypothetical protein
LLSGKGHFVDHGLSWAFVAHTDSRFDADHAIGYRANDSSLNQKTTTCWLPRHCWRISSPSRKATFRTRRGFKLGSTTGSSTFQRDRASGVVWSAGYQPSGLEPGKYDVALAAEPSAPLLG